MSLYLVYVPKYVYGVFKCSKSIFHYKLIIFNSFFSALINYAHIFIQLKNYQQLFS